MTKTYTTDFNQTLPVPQQEVCSARLAAVAPPASCSHTQPINILRLPDVIKRVGLKRASIYLHIAQGHFPKQISLGPRAVGWLEHEIDAWLAARMRTSRGNSERHRV